MNQKLIIFKREAYNIALSRFPLRSNKLQSLKTLLTKVCTSENRDNM